MKSYRRLEVNSEEIQEEKEVVYTHIRVVWFVQNKKTVSCGSELFLKLVRRSALAVGHGDKKDSLKSFWLTFQGFLSKKYPSAETIKTPALSLMLEFQRYLLNLK